jgi:translation initiation factor 1
MNDRRLVYSSDSGRVGSPAPQKPKAKARAQAPKANVPDDGVVRLFREKGGRGGKTVTVVRGLPAADVDRQVSDLKRLCGAGGTVRDGAIEIQGDHRERIAQRLQRQGYQVKLAGG